jgi:hypothetical protein
VDIGELIKLFFESLMLAKKKLPRARANMAMANRIGQTKAASVPLAPTMNLLIEDPGISAIATLYA